MYACWSCCQRAEHEDEKIGCSRFVLAKLANISEVEVSFDVCLFDGLDFEKHDRNQKLHQNVQAHIVG